MLASLLSTKGATIALEDGTFDKKYRKPEFQTLH